MHFNRLALIIAIVWLVLGLVFTLTQPNNLISHAILGSGFLFSGYAVMISKKSGVIKNVANPVKKQTWI